MVFVMPDTAPGQEHLVGVGDHILFDEIHLYERVPAIIEFHYFDSASGEQKQFILDTRKVDGEVIVCDGTQVTDVPVRALPQGLKNY